MSPKTRDAERTRAAILEAARRLFAERDISAVSIRDIAQAAGVSHGLVQHHFGTRERLVAAIVQDEIDEFAARPRALVGGRERSRASAHGAQSRHDALPRLRPAHHAR